MSETQFEKMCKKMCKALAKAERELREDNERLREDNELLRELLRKCQPYFTSGAAVRLDEKALKRLLKEIQKEVGDE